MTTIAYRDGVIAADTGMSYGNSRHGECSKIARNHRGDLAGAAGAAGFVAPFLRWFSTGEGDGPDKPVPKSDNSGSDISFIVRAGGSIEVQDSGGSYTVTAPYYAIGSGSPEALGAMFAGADPEMAVRAAMQHDSHTWGDVVILKRDES